MRVYYQCFRFLLVDFIKIRTQSSRPCRSFFTLMKAIFALNCIFIRNYFIRRPLDAGHEFIEFLFGFWKQYPRKFLNYIFHFEIFEVQIYFLIFIVQLSRKRSPLFLLLLLQECGEWIFISYAMHKDVLETRARRFEPSRSLESRRHKFLKLQHSSSRLE